jgi:hypothetical protein
VELKKSDSIIDWLLEEDNPSVRYFTLKYLLDKDENSPQVEEAKSAIPNSKIVAKIFSKQNAKGYWGDKAIPYLPKYKASYWQIMVLGCLGLHRSDKRVQKACEYIFTFQQKDGGFTGTTEAQAQHDYNYYLKKGKTLSKRDVWISARVYEGQMSCLTGNTIAALIRLGYGTDPRVKKALTWLVKVQNRDGGWLCPYWPAHRNDTHGCFYGTICPLQAFSKLSRDEITREVKRAVRMGAEFLLMHRLYRADHHNYRIIRKSWLDLSFPWFYRYSILWALDVLTKLGYTKDIRLKDALNIVLEKRQKDGTWILESTPSGRMHASLGVKGRPSKWITLSSLRVLKRCNISLDF